MCEGEWQNKSGDLSGKGVNHKQEYDVGSGKASFPTPPSPAAVLLPVLIAESVTAAQAVQ